MYKRRSRCLAVRYTIILQPASSLPTLSLANGTIMTRYTKCTPFMNPNVFRSSSHSHYNTRHDSLSPRQATIDLSRSLYRDGYFGEPLDRQDAHHYDSCISYDYGSDRRHRDQFTSTSRDIDDLVRRYARLERHAVIPQDADRIRTNHNAVLTNNAIEQVTSATLIQPKVLTDGHYPLDFATPMTISNLMALPEGQLDRLLEDYDIASPGSAGYSTRDCDCDSTTERESRLSKLTTLLRFLGARRIADVLRSAPGGGGSLSGSRPPMMSRRR
jgi:hypothetical protein